MTRDDIIRMAREAGGTDMQPFDYGAKPDRMILQYKDIEKFANLLAAAEREACAKIIQRAGLPSIADAIRARGEE